MQHGLTMIAFLVIQAMMVYFKATYLYCQYMLIKQRSTAERENSSIIYGYPQNLVLDMIHTHQFPDRNEMRYGPYPVC